MKINFITPIEWDGKDEYMLNFIKNTFVREQSVLFVCSKCNCQDNSNVRSIHLNKLCHKCSCLGNNKGHSNNKLPIIPKFTFIKTEKELELYKSYNKRSNLYFNCNVCGNVSFTRLSSLLKNFNLTCKLCKMKQTNIEKYGSETPFGNKQVQEKCKQVILEKYGVENISQNEKIQEKCKQTCLERYGTEYSFQSENNKQKSKETCLKKYGVEHYSQTNEFLQKTQQTCQEHYGVSFPLQSKEIMEKLKVTNIEKYGVECSLLNPQVIEKCKQTNLILYGKEHYSQTEEFKEKFQNTCLELFGVPYPIQCDQVRLKQQQTCLERFGVTSNLLLSKHSIRYKYQDITFDSSWEIIFFLYHKSLGHNVKREPRSLIYISNNKTYHYYPDFEVENQLYEVKGDYFFNEKNELIDPYDTSITAQQKALDKYKCAVSNNVIFIRGNDIKEMSKYLTNIEQTLKESRVT